MTPNNLPYFVTLIILESASQFSLSSSSSSSITLEAAVEIIIIDLFDLSILGKNSGARGGYGHIHTDIMQY